MANELTIGELAYLAGVTAVALRYYERCGLLPKASRSTGGYRTYPRSIVGKVRFIKNAQSLGFTLKEIQELLDLQTKDNVSRQDIKSLAINKLTIINQKISTLQQMASALHQLTMKCDGDDSLQHCPILEALYEGK